MSSLIYIVFLLVSLPQARADESQFTVSISHEEFSEKPGFDRKAFEGRAWDIAALVRAAQDGQALQWVLVERRPNQLGSNYCIRVRQTLDGKSNGAAVPYFQRVRVLNNLLVQLRFRQIEMANANASYKVLHPSTCGTQNDTRFSRRNLR